MPWDYQIIVKDLTALFILSVTGASGGYLAAIQRRTGFSFRGTMDSLSNSNAKGFSKRKVTLYYMMTGVAGAIIIITLSPVDSKILDALFVSDQQPNAPEQFFIKLIALALIGGYAGGSLLESSASQFAKRIDKIEENQENWSARIATFARRR